MSITHPVVPTNPTRVWPQVLAPLPSHDATTQGPGPFRTRTSRSSLLPVPSPTKPKVAAMPYGHPLRALARLLMTRA